MNLLHRSALLLACWPLASSARHWRCSSCFGASGGRVRSAAHPSARICFVAQAIPCESSLKWRVPISALRGGNQGLHKAEARRRQGRCDGSLRRQGAEISDLDGEGTAGPGRTPSRMAGQVAWQCAWVVGQRTASAGAARMVRRSNWSRSGQGIQRQRVGRPVRRARFTVPVCSASAAGGAPDGAAMPNCGAAVQRRGDGGVSNPHAARCVCGLVGCRSRVSEPTPVTDR